MIFQIKSMEKAICRAKILLKKSSNGNVLRVTNQKIKERRTKSKVLIIMPGPFSLKMFG